MRAPIELHGLALLLATACAGGPPPDPRRATGGAEHRVRVERDQAVLAAFEGSLATAVLDGRHLSIELGSPDGLHRLAIEVDGSGPGVYSVAPSFEAAKAVIVLVSHGVPARVSPAQGELTLVESAEGHCSGSFAARATDTNGYRYVFEGSFSHIPVRRL